ncbi:hypothetical protein J4573_12090 [Actinomadura barringtoniae]|uniref:Uncharacterized protein n=1 Tax=Actinomadura barringtoniae TaxID=1427535 RepID=A0A939T480_9ACTN|nr:DUF6069 family protein [Actinomadura barringtoniae]MBO2447834.1 hypothetical protein [Actinomadura barringtoniae]
MNTRTRSRALTVAAAVLAGTLAWTVAGPVAGLHLQVRNSQHVGLAQVVIASLLAGLAAWILLLAFERFTSSARPAWTVAAVIVLVLSLTGPLGATSATAGITLACLHLLVGTVIILGLRRRPAGS